MNSKIKKFSKNISYTLISNITALAISSLSVLIVPNFIGLSQYGYWQLYIFYNSYVGYLSFGLTDGAYLRYGGEKYNNLNKPLFVSQFWFLVIINILLDSMLVFGYCTFIGDASKHIVIILTCISGILCVPRSLLTYMLLATNRIKHYAFITVLERVVYFIFVLLFLVIKLDKFYWYILADIIGKLVSLVYAIVKCREIVIGKLASYKESFKEIKNNISVGINLLFASLASMLIIGIVRMCIEKQWDIETFGKVSLTMSISNLLMVFINAVGVTMFPMLRRTNADKLPKIYVNLRTILMTVLFGALIFYYPGREILEWWLPKYKDGLIYMALLFPMCIFESKISALVNTYLKNYRKEKQILFVNISTLALSCIGSVICVFVIKSLNLTILLITILLAFRCILSEKLLAKFIKINVNNDIILEIVLVVIFICTGWYMKSLYGFIIYLFAYLVYLCIKKKDILETIKLVKKSK